MVRPIRSWIWPAAAKLPLLDPMRFAVFDLAGSLRGRSEAVAPSLAGPIPVATGDLTGSDSLLKLIPTAIAPGTAGLVTINAPQADPNETSGRPCDKQWRPFPIGMKPHSGSDDPFCAGGK